MQTLLDLRYASKEHLAHDLHELGLTPKQYNSLLSCLRRYIGHRIALKRKTQTCQATIYLTIFLDDLKINSKVSSNGFCAPFSCADWD